MPCLDAVAGMRSAGIGPGPGGKIRTAVVAAAFVQGNVVVVAVAAAVAAVGAAWSLPVRRRGCLAVAKPVRPAEPLAYRSFAATVQESGSSRVTESALAIG